MEHILYWLWLSLKFKSMNAKITALFEIFEDVESIYLSKSFNNIRGITESDRALLEDKNLSKANEVFEQMAALRGKIITFDDENYPQILKQLHDPPCVLYIKGKVPELDSVLTIGVVGTRRASDYGRMVTQRLCVDLAKAGAVTISGMASGIDAIGAWATIEEGSIAVGVIGSGIDIVYPVENAELYKAVADRGCIMSEYPPGVPPISKHFPARNRIIAGLSRGVLVTEAPERSGALITARFAMENGRDVFAVPRDITDIKYQGTNTIIQQGAKLIRNAEDILCEYPYARKIEPVRMVEKPVKTMQKSVPKLEVPKQTASKAAIRNSEKLKGLNEKEKAVAELLIKGDMQIDEIARELAVPVGELNTRLVMLEMKGVIRKLPGSMYRLKV